MRDEPRYVKYIWFAIAVPFVAIEVLAEFVGYWRLRYWTWKNNLRILTYIPAAGYIISLKDRDWPVAMGFEPLNLLGWLKANRHRISAGYGYEPSEERLRSQLPWDRIPGPDSTYTVDAPRSRQVRVKENTKIPVEWEAD